MIPKSTLRAQVPAQQVTQLGLSGPQTKPNMGLSI